jgi:hypothetical protein
MTLHATSSRKLRLCRGLRGKGQFAVAGDMADQLSAGFAAVALVEVYVSL